jgi:hypothetical protein
MYNIIDNFMIFNLSIIDMCHYLNYVKNMV